MAKPKRPETRRGAPPLCAASCRAARAGCPQFDVAQASSPASSGGVPPPVKPSARKSGGTPAQPAAGTAALQKIHAVAQAAVALRALPAKARGLRGYYPNSEIGMGGTGDPPVSSGHWSDETRRMLAMDMDARKRVGAFPVPGGGSPPGTGQVAYATHRNGRRRFGFQI
jgi:hypothetical protein